MKFELLPYWIEIPKGSVLWATSKVNNLPVEVCIDNSKPGYMAEWTGVFWAVPHPSVATPFVDLPASRTGETVKLHPIHFAVRIEDNPIEVQWQWSVEEGTQTAFLNVHTATEKQLTEARRVLNQFMEIMQQGRGGGRKARPKEKRRALVEKWFGLQSKVTKGVFADIEGITVKTLNEWIKQYERGEI